MKEERKDLSRRKQPKRFGERPVGFCFKSQIIGVILIEKIYHTVIVHACF